MKRLLCLILLLCCGVAWGDEAVDICFNYGCSDHALAIFSEARLREIWEKLQAALHPEDERLIMSVVVGQLYSWAGEQTPIRADRAGNYADDGVFGRMDCIDHSHTTERFLNLLERRGMLRFHRVIGLTKRARLIFEHYAVLIEETGDAAADSGEEGPPRYVVDSWYVNNGEPAVILPERNWIDGEGPDV